MPKVPDDMSAAAVAAREKLSVKLKTDARKAAATTETERAPKIRIAKKR